MNSQYRILRQKALKTCNHVGILNAPITVRAKALSTTEAIGNPDADDFPIQKGKERLMQAAFGNGLGQAFTDRYGNFEGRLKTVLDLPLENNYQRAVFIAALNAVLHHLEQISETIHCRDNEPNQCADRLEKYIKDRYGNIKIGLVGFQPRMLETLAKAFPLRLLDLDPDNIGSQRFNVWVEGPQATEKVIAWADLLLVTGTTIVNGTIEQFLGKKPVLFYGTTIAGAAALMGWNRFCACGH